MNSHFNKITNTILSLFYRAIEALCVPHQTRDCPDLNHFMDKAPDEMLLKSQSTAKGDSDKSDSFYFAHSTVRKWGKCSINILGHTLPLHPGCTKTFISLSQH